MSPNPKLEIEIAIDLAKPGRRRQQAKPRWSDQPRVSRLSRLMALAIKFQDMIDRGEVRDYSNLARLGYVSRARLTQIMNLLLLAPDIQEQLLLSESTVQERNLRILVKLPGWPDQ